ncbi:MAG: hypothetical protein HQK83_15865 [Fibrobacteria bacterium]|nr:hypothetical protein [Fibrobacteria bacterium]
MKLLYLLYSFVMLSSGFSGVQHNNCANQESSLKVLVIYNDAGNKAVAGKNFLLDALSDVPGARTLPSSTVTWNQIVSMYRTGGWPDVIVHANGGWQKYSGPNITHFDEQYSPGKGWSFNWMGPKGCNKITKNINNEIIQNVFKHKIGLVSMGDDAMHPTKCLCGINKVFTNDNNIGDGRRFKYTGDEMWVRLDKNKDVTGDPGIIKSAVNILGSDKMLFKLGATSGPDVFSFLNTTYSKRFTAMGYQQAYDKSLNLPVGSSTQYPVIGTYTYGNFRSVMLNYNPETIANINASKQIIYDAVMWAADKPCKRQFTYQVIKD